MHLPKSLQKETTSPSGVGNATIVVVIPGLMIPNLDSANKNSRYMYHIRNLDIQLLYKLCNLIGSASHHI